MIGVGLAAQKHNQAHKPLKKLAEALSVKKATEQKLGSKLKTTMS